MSASAGKRVSKAPDRYVPAETKLRGDFGAEDYDPDDPMGLKDTAPAKPVNPEESDDDFVLGEDESESESEEESDEDESDDEEEEEEEEDGEMDDEEEPDPASKAPAP